jgi:hypothetical protein
MCEAFQNGKTETDRARATFDQFGNFRVELKGSPNRHRITCYAAALNDYAETILRNENNPEILADKTRNITQADAALSSEDRDWIRRNIYHER